MHFPKRLLLLSFAALAAISMVVVLVLVVRGAGTYCKPQGLQYQLDGSGVQYFCVTSNTTTPVAVNTPFDYKFSIVTSNGATFKNFQVSHERLLHLLIVRKDLQYFQHVHPEFDPVTGQFSINLQLPAPGPYRFFADFVSGDSGLEFTSTQDVIAANDKLEPATLKPTTTFSTDDYKVELLSKPTSIHVGDEAIFAFAITKNGAVVQDLGPYLGAFGHAIILREGTLDFIHTHPIDYDAATGQVLFHAQLQQQGNYKIFAQFKHHGKLLTADFVVSVAPK